MGGMWGEVRADHKIDTYLRCVEECEGWPGTHDPNPEHQEVVQTAHGASAALPAGQRPDGIFAPA